MFKHLWDKKDANNPVTTFGLPQHFSPNSANPARPFNPDDNPYYKGFSKQSASIITQPFFGSISGATQAAIR